MNYLSIFIAAGALGVSIYALLIAKRQQQTTEQMQVIQLNEYRRKVTPSLRAKPRVYDNMVTLVNEGDGPALGFRAAVPGVMGQTMDGVVPPGAVLNIETSARHLAYIYKSQAEDWFGERATVQNNEPAYLAATAVVTDDPEKWLREAQAKLAPTIFVPTLNY